jgi:hypothetical protein
LQAASEVGWAWGRAATAASACSALTPCGNHARRSRHPVRRCHAPLTGAGKQARRRCRRRHGVLACSGKGGVTRGGWTLAWAPSTWSTHRPSASLQVRARAEGIRCMHLSLLWAGPAEVWFGRSHGQSREPEARVRDHPRGHERASGLHWR